jgi:hypothetical protein
LEKFIEKNISVKNIKNTTNELEHLFETLTQ